MEPWQIEYINKNMTALIRMTNYSPSFQVRLIENNLISEEEAQYINASVSAVAKCEALYRILITRRRGYEGLLDALKTTYQTGACQILEFGLESQAVSSENVSRVLNIPVQLNNTVRPLKEVFPNFTDNDARVFFLLERAQKKLSEVHEDDSKLLRLDGELLTVNSLHVPRFISNRLTLDPRVFMLDCKDVFVFKGMEEVELLKLVKPYVTRASSSQLPVITCRHIVLVRDGDWDHLVEEFQGPIHLVAKHGNCFYLESSNGVTDIIQHHTLDDTRSEDAFISEERFAEKLQSGAEVSSKCNTVVLCDIPGMGKTWFMHSLATKLTYLSQNSFSQYIHLPTFSNHIVNIMTYSSSDLDTLELILGCVYRSNLVGHLVVKHGVSRKMKLFLFLDEFDGVSSNDMDLVLKLFTCFRRMESLRVMISSRPHTQRQLETVLKVIPYKFLPLGKQEQINLTVEHWKLSVPNSDSELLKIYAGKCIESFRQGINNILGVPIKCYMLAVINEESVRTLTATNCWDKQVVDYIETVAHFYQRFVEQSMNKLGASDLGNILISYHTREALAILFPGTVKTKIQDIIKTEELKKKNANGIERVGLLEHKPSGDTFTDRGVAEFMVAQLVVDFVTGVKSPYNCIPLGDSKLCETLFQTFSNGMQAINGVCLDGFLVKVKTSFFHHSSILDFINQLIFSNNTFSEEISLDNSFLKFLKENLFTVVIACIEANFLNLLYLIQCLLKQTSRHHRLSSLLVAPKQLFVKPATCLSSVYDNWIDTNRKTASSAYVLYQIATRGTSKIAEAVFELFSCENYNFYQHISDQLPADWPSPVQLAIHSNNLDVIKYLAGKISFHGRTLRSCLIGNNMSAPEKKMRKLICDVVFNQNSLVLNEFKNSIDEDMHIFEYNINFLSYVCLNHKLNLKDLTINAKQRIIDAGLLCYNDAQFITLLLLLFASSDTVTDFIKSNRNMTKFNEYIASQRFDIDGARMALFEVKCEKYDYLFEIHDIETLKLLVGIYDDFSSTNSYQRNLLHMSVSECKLDWIKVLLRDKRFNINQKDKQGNTPILCINAWNPIEITKLLMENDANIYAVNNKQQNIAHILLQHYSDPDPIYIAWTKMLLEMGHEQLWYEPDTLKNTPEDLMEKKWGRRNPFSLINHLIQMKTEPKRNCQRYSGYFQYVIEVLFPKK